MKNREKRGRDWEEEMEERRLEKRKRERQDAYEEVGLVSCTLYVCVCVLFERLCCICHAV